MGLTSQVSNERTRAVPVVEISHSDAKLRSDFLEKRSSILVYCELEGRAKSEFHHASAWTLCDG